MKLIVDRVGLGYQALVPEVSVGLALDRLVESRGELSGMLTVRREEEGHLYAGRFNLSSLTARTSAAKFLSGRAHLNGAGPDWTTILEHFCVAVIEREQEGAPVVTLGARRPRVPLEWVYEPFIVGGAKATVLYGYGGYGKSTLAGAAAVAVASGVPTFAGWRVPAARRVLVLDWEADEDDWNDIIAGVSEGIGIEAPQIEYQACDRPLPNMVHQLARTIAERSIGLVIVDSVGFAIPSARDGASYEEGAMRLFKALRTLAVPALLIDHTGKGDEGREGPYGSAYKWHSMRHGWQLVAGEEAAEDGALHLALLHRKHNLTAEHAPIGIKVVRGEGQILLLAEDIAEDGRLESSMTIAQRIELVMRRNGGRPMKVGDIATEVGTGPKTIGVTLGRGHDRFVKVGQEGRDGVWALKSNMLSNDLQHVVDAEVQHVAGVLDFPAGGLGGSSLATPKESSLGGGVGEGQHVGDRAGSSATTVSSPPGTVASDRPKKGGPFDSIIEFNERQR